MYILFGCFFALREETLWQKARSQQIVASNAVFSFSRTQFWERTVSEINRSPQIKLRADNKQLDRQKDRKASRWTENQNSNVDKWTIESRMPKTGFTPRGRKSNGGVAGCILYKLCTDWSSFIGAVFGICLGNTSTERLTGILLLTNLNHLKEAELDRWFWYSIAKWTDTRNHHRRVCFQGFSYRQSELLFESTYMPASSIITRTKFSNPPFSHSKIATRSLFIIPFYAQGASLLNLAPWRKLSDFSHPADSPGLGKLQDLPGGWRRFRKTNTVFWMQKNARKMPHHAKNMCVRFRPKVEKGVG